MTASPEGRRVLVATVTGEAGERIQAWRQRFDPEQADRIVPHATLAYWAPVPDGDEQSFDRQVRHAFPGPVPLRLGTVHEFDNADRTLYMEIRDTAALDDARTRLFDRTWFTFPDQRQIWDWHVTVVRYGCTMDLEHIQPHLNELPQHTTWTLATIEWLELRDGRYRALHRWQLGMQPSRVCTC